MSVMSHSFYKRAATFLSILLLHISPNAASMETTSGPNNTDVLALLDIKSKIIDDPQGALTSWNDSIHFCQWQGVRCGNRHKRVTALNLSSKGLVGSLSPSIGNLSFLREVRLQENALQGEIPSQIGRLFRLQLLRLENNSFVGEIPANLSKCSNLRVLLMGYNKLTGKIPEELTYLPMLTILAIHRNNLTGGIPPSIGNLTSLATLSLTDCLLGGSIPDVFHWMNNLRQVGFGGNKLTGIIPLSLYNLSMLSILSVTENELSGSIPTNIGLMLPNLQILQIGTNNFTGPLPPSISNCSQLVALAVGNNNFNGKITIDFGALQNLRRVSLGDNNFGSGEGEMEFIGSLCNSSNLEILDISNSQLSGVMSDYMWNFSTKLSYLSLGANSIFGTIPSSIGNLFGLTELDLFENRFTGMIPFSIGMLQNLQKLSLWNNNFTGKIPDSIGNLSLLIEVSLDGNKFQGAIPSSLGNCQQMISLSLSQNNLSGNIPRELFRLSSLSIMLNLGQNHLSGPIPPEIGNLKTLSKLVLSENNLSGDLPTSLSSCISLEHLDLSNNSFQGSIPTSFASLRALQVLNLSRNNFSGQIPTYFEQFPLETLNLSFNNFEGRVPAKGVFSNGSAISVVGNNRLCGGMAELQLPECILQHSKRRGKLSITLIILISILSTLVAAAIVIILLFSRRIKKRKDQASQSSLGSLQKVSYGSLLKATAGFSSENLIGTGSFASVYKGVLHEEGFIVAVKVLNLQRQGGFKSFIAECEALRNVRHRNLVKVITSCSSVDFQGNDFKAIVYEFMPNGSLERWLHASSTTHVEDEIHQLDLLQRISIAIDVACALDYLHNRCGKAIVHCDLKPSNILLDRDMVAHVGDFGLAKLLLPEITNTNQSISSVGIRGTIGYTAPEYGLGSEISTAGDVYSFGILLLEMLTGMRPTDPMFQEGLTLHSYSKSALEDGVDDIADPILLENDTEKITQGPTSDNRIEKKGKNGKNKEECLISLFRIGVACSMESPQDRKDISSVVNELHLIKSAILSF